MILDMTYHPVTMITSSKIYTINQKPPVGSRHNDNAKYTEGGGNYHLTKNIRENMELSKYSWYGILVPHNNGNFNLTGVDGDQVRPHKLQTQMRS